jgi:hypothetical protein
VAERKLSYTPRRALLSLTSLYRGKTTSFILAIKDLRWPMVLFSERLIAIIK